MNVLPKHSSLETASGEPVATIEVDPRRPDDQS